jgi:hypothetical protein
MTDNDYIAKRKPQTDYEKPTEGQHQGVICEVEILKNHTFKGCNGNPDKVDTGIRIWWQLATKDSKGRPFYLTAGKGPMLMSLHEKSNLFAFIKALFKKEPPVDFDTRKLIGTQRMLTIVLNPGKGDNANKMYANVAAMITLPANTPKLEIVARPKRDEVKAEVAKSLAVTEANPITDEDIPF